MRLRSPPSDLPNVRSYTTAYHLQRQTRDSPVRTIPRVPFLEFPVVSGAPGHSRQQPPYPQCDRTSSSSPSPHLPIFLLYISCVKPAALRPTTPCAVPPKHTASVVCTKATFYVSMQPRYRLPKDRERHCFPCEILYFYYSPLFSFVPDESGSGCCCLSIHRSFRHRSIGISEKRAPSSFTGVVGSGKTKCAPSLCTKSENV